MWKVSYQILFTGNFSDAATNKVPVNRTPRSMLLAKIGFIFWTIVNIIFTYATLISVMFQCWIIYHSLLFLFVTWKFGGFHKIQYKLCKT